MTYRSTRRPTTSRHTPVTSAPRLGRAANLDATIVTSKDTLAAIASAALEVPSRQADRLIAINADTAAAQRLLTSFNKSTR
jgi:hypothetical protein